MKIIAVKNGEAAIWKTSIKSAAEDEGCPKEMNALDYLQDICGFTIIVVPDMGVAEEIATSYHGKEKYTVQEKAWEILREGGKYEEVKRRQIESLCDSGNITFNLAGSRLSITYSDGQYSYKSTLEKDEYDEWTVELFDENEALKMLGIADDDDMISYLIECIGVEKEENN